MLVGLVGSSAYVSAESAGPVPNPIGKEGVIPSAVNGVGGAAENMAPRFIERGSNFERWDLGGGRFAWNSAPQWVWDGSEWVPYIYENRWEDGYYQVQSGLIGARFYDYYAEFHTPDLSEIRVNDERWEVQRWVAKGRGRWDDVGAQSGTQVFSVLENGNDITVRKTFNSWAGELEINYIFREGLPLKRDVVWTSAIEENTTFRVLQRWAGIAGDKVRHGGGENRVTAALVIDSPFFEFGDDNGMTVLEEQHSMYYDEKGERLTEHCLRPVAVDVHARGLKADFAFENWTLAPGESLVVDPYTSTLNNPTQDGHVYYYYASGMSGYSRDSTGDVIKMYDMIVVPYYIYYYYRGYVEWDVSSIPDGATISDTDFKYHGKSTGSGAHINEMLGARPSTSSDLAVYTEIGEGTTYANPAGFPEAGTNKQVDLGGDADLDLQDQLSSDWFAIGLMGEGTSTTEIYSEDYASANPKPTLYVEYLMNVTKNLNVPYYSQDTIFYCGPACAQMWIDYRDGFVDQDELASYIRANNLEGDLWYTDPHGLQATLDNYISGYTHYDQTYSSASSGTFDVVQHIEWHDAPAAVLTFHGGHWMLVKGSYYQKDDQGNVTDVYGVYVHDPQDGGIGSNTYMSASDWNTDYFTDVDVSGSQWDGYWVAVVCPPDNEDILPAEFYDEPERGPVSEGEAVEVAIEGLRNHMLFETEPFALYLDGTVPGEPIYVKSIGDVFPSYYLVPFVKDGRIWVVVTVNAELGTFMGASYSEKGLIEYPMVSREEAFIAVKQAIKTIDNCIPPERIELVWKPCQQSWNIYAPFWSIETNYGTVYVGQNGKLYYNLSSLPERPLSGG